jgi:predicted GNAT superfamily acetyltransferase
MRPEELELRDLVAPDDVEQCLSLQRATWGDDFRELVPPAVLQIAQKVGGLAVGAFDDEQTLVGFVFGITGVRAGRLTHWSHMLAVREDRRDAGVGRILKQHQRQRLLELGVDSVLWTFDPLVARNAHLNLNRLRVRVLEYVEGMYGENPMSRTDSVIGTDRLVVEWMISGESPPATAPELPQVTPVVSSGAVGAEPDLADAPAVLVEVPPDVQSLKINQPKVALAWRASTRRAFAHYLGSGYRITAFERSPDRSRCYYVLQLAEQSGA